MTDYRGRVVDTLLDDLLPELPAVVLQGPKGVGKTETARRRATSVLALDRAADRELLAADPSLPTRLDGPVLIDEWQRAPDVWDTVRRDVDDRGDGGRYLLTGSATPQGTPLHSGAGRIVPIRMRPLSLAERGLERPTVSLTDLLSGGARIEGTTSLGLTEYVEEIVASGLPGIRGAAPRARALRLDAYLDAVVEREFPEQGLAVRRPEVLRAWLRAFAAATSTTASYNSVLDAATPGGSDKPAKTTTIAYRDVLSSLWLTDSLDAWQPGSGELGRLGSAPKHQLADPALAARLLGLDAAALQETDTRADLRRGSMLGALFEHLVALSVQVYALCADATVLHLRTRNGDHAVDLVVRRPDGRVLAIEVKLAAVVADRDVRHLDWLRHRVGDRLVDAVVVTTGRDAYRRADGTAVVPAALLGP